jgi:hypothetical protein
VEAGGGGCPYGIPFVLGVVPPSAALLHVIADFGSLGVAGDGGSRDCMLRGQWRWRARKTPHSMGQVGGRDEAKLVYSMLSVQLHVR